MFVLFLVIASAYYFIKYKYHIYSMIFSVIFKVFCSIIVISLVLRLFFRV